MRRLSLSLAGLALIALGLSFAARADELPPASKTKVDFTKHILPLFKKHCFECHGEKMQEAGLRLDRKSGPHGDSGKAILAGKSAESLLILYSAGADSDTVMPPSGDYKQIIAMIQYLEAVNAGAATTDRYDYTAYADVPQLP